MSGPERNAEDPKEALTFDQLSPVVTQLEDGPQAFERGVARSRLGSKPLAGRLTEQNRDRDSAFRRGVGR